MGGLHVVLEDQLRGADQRRQRQRRAGGIGGIRARIELVPIVEAVLVAVDAGARARAGRHAGVGQLLVRRRRRHPAQGGVAERRLGFAIADELPAGAAQPAARLAAHGPLDDQVALAQAGARDEQVETRPHRAGVGRRQRDLLADDRGQVAVEGEQELLDLMPFRIAREADAGPAHRVVGEDVGVEEAEQRVDAAVVKKAEAAHLGPLRRLIERPRPRHVELPEHADLLVQVAQVRDLDDLLLVLEAGAPVGAEVPELGLQAVTALAREAQRLAEERAGGAVRQPRPEKEVPPRLLRRRQRVVERAHRVRGQRDLQGEVGELLHVRRRQLAVAADERHEGAVEVVERVHLVEGRGRRSGRIGTIAAPVHGAAADQAAQGLRRHRPLHRMEVVHQSGAVDRQRAEGTHPRRRRPPG